MLLEYGPDLEIKDTVMRITLEKNLLLFLHIIRKKEKKSEI